MVGAAWLAQQVSRHPTADHLLAAPTYKVLQQSTLKKFFSEFPWYRQFYNESKNVIALPTGGNIYIRSTDDPFGLEGMTVASAWLDEGGQMKADVYTVVQARVAIARGQILITTTPYNMGWLYQEVVKPAQHDTQHFTIVNWSSEQNPYFPKEEFERVRNTMDAVTFDMRYRGVFRKRHGLVYPAFDEHALYTEPPRGFNEVVGGIDWGYTVPSAAIVVGIDYDRHYWAQAEYYARQRTTAEIVHACLQLQVQYRVNVWYCDPAEPDRIEEAKRAGLYVREANKDVKAGIDVVRQAFNENRLHIKRGLTNTIDELETYHYPEEGQAGYVKDVPVKEDDHAMDALRYAVYTHHPQGLDVAQLQTIAKNRQAPYGYK